ncbi:phosphate acyltransferase [Enterococcus gilvus]|uniref:phosphate acyltransferase n=1 Tax=Enterococcus gilvus TaxID=160453 RepID=UPI00345E4D28
MFQTLEAFYESAKSKGRKHVAVAAADDFHTLEAVHQAEKDGAIFPILIGLETGIKEKLTTIDPAFSNFAVINEEDETAMAKLAVQQVKEKKAHFIMKGMLNTGTLLKEIVNKEEGLNKGGTISHISIVEIPGYHKLLLLTDCGIMITPNAQQKAAIIQNAVDLLLTAGYTCPKVAALSTVEFVNPKMPDTVDAAALQAMNEAGDITNCVVEGPISFDIALNAETAKLKGYQGVVPGDPDILLVPSIATGNILIKALGRFVPNIRTIALASGAGIPIVVTSRGTPVVGKYRSLLAACAVAKEQ